MQRRKMNFTFDALYLICRTEEESVTHPLRDCPASQEVWKMLIKPVYWSDFLKGNTVEWFTFNSKNEIGNLENLNWKVIFW